METKKLLRELHTDNMTWLNKLAFYEDEIEFLRKQVEKVAAKSDDDKILALCESYLNRLSIQRHEIHTIRDRVRMDERELALAERANPKAMNAYFPDETEEREAMETFERIYTELKEELLEFFSKTKR